MDVLLRSNSTRVGFPLIAAEEITLHHRQSHAYNRHDVTPSLPVSARHGRGSRETEGEGVEEVRKGDRGESIVEVCGWLVGVAERTVRQDIGTVCEVEKPSVQGSDLWPQNAVSLGEPRDSAGEIEAGEEDIIGGLQARGCCGEDIFWSEIGNGGNEGEDGGEEEDGEGLGDWPRHRLHRGRGRGSDCLDFLGAIPGYEPGNEEGPHSEEEGFEAVGMSVQA